MAERPHYSHKYPPDSEKSPAGVDAGGPQNKEAIRYWSDFSRVSYLPRTIHTVPDPGDWGAMGGVWNAGQEIFFRYNEVRSLITSNLSH